MALKKIKKISSIFIYLLFSIYLILPNFASANGFGISPAQIHVQHLKPGTKNITASLAITRNNADKKIEIKNTVTKIKNWVTVNNNQPIILEATKHTILLPIDISIPKSTAPGKYAGTIIFSERTMIDQKNNTGSQTQISYKVAIKVEVSDQSIREIKIKDAKIASALASIKHWIFKLPGKLYLSLRVANTGNTTAAIEKIKLTIYDKNLTKVIKQINKRFLPSIPAFSEQDVVVDIPAKLDIDDYIVVADIFGPQNQAPIFSQRLYTKTLQPNYSQKEALYILVTYYWLEIIAMIVVLILIVVVALNNPKFHKKKITAKAEPSNLRPYNLNHTSSNNLDWDGDEK